MRAQREGATCMHNMRTTLHVTSARKKLIVHAQGTSTCEHEGAIYTERDPESWRRMRNSTIPLASVASYTTDVRTDIGNVTLY